MSEPGAAESEPLEVNCRSGPFTRCRYVLKDTEVDFSLQSPAHVLQVSIPLEAMSPRPVHDKSWPMGRVWIALVLLLIGGSFLASAAWPGPHHRGSTAGLAITGSAFVLASLAFGASFLLGRRDYLVFVAPDGRAALRLPYAKPDPKTFAAFVHELCSRIERRTAEQHAPLIAPEIADIARLLRQGRITAAQVRQATDRLLAGGPGGT